MFNSEDLCVFTWCLTLSTSAITLNSSRKRHQTLSGKRWISSSVATDTIKLHSITVSGFIHYFSTLLDLLCAVVLLIYQRDSKCTSVRHLAGFQLLSMGTMLKLFIYSRCDCGCSALRVPACLNPKDDLFFKSPFFSTFSSKSILSILLLLSTELLPPHTHLPL